MLEFSLPQPGRDWSLALVRKGYQDQHVKTVESVFIRESYSSKKKEG
jgi:hypothetical protein